MRTGTLIIINKGVWKIEAAESFWTRFKGLMGRKSLPEKTALWITKCGSIHCCFMRFSIDVVYLDKNRRVLKKETVKPWHIGSVVKKADSVLEMNEGEAKNVKRGDLAAVRL